MNRKQLFAVTVLALGLQGFANASPFPADGEASYNLPARDSYAERQARMGDCCTTERQVSVFPADAEASWNLPARESYAERHARIDPETFTTQGDAPQVAVVSIGD